MPKKFSSKNGTAANLGFEAKLWLAADKLRNNMDAAEYKHVVLGLIFESHGGKLRDISIYDRESNATARRLAIMDLAIRRHLHTDLHAA